MAGEGRSEGGLFLVKSNPTRPSTPRGRESRPMTVGRVVWSANDGVKKILEGGCCGGVEDAELGGSESRRVFWPLRHRVLNTC